MPYIRKVYIPSIPTRWDAATEQRVPSVDLNPASKYGDLIAMSNGTGSLKDQIEEVSHKADDVQPEDLVLCVGDVVLTAVAIARVHEINGAVTLLRWDKQRHGYDEVEVRL